MSPSIIEKLAAARQALPAMSPEEAAKLLGRQDGLFVDVRDGDEVAKSGKVAGALNVSRGMLEFRADPASPAFNDAFAKDKTIVLYCASGGRSALAGQTLRDLGYDKVRNLGGFKDWADKGLPTEKA